MSKNELDNDNFYNAVVDYLYLLERSYSSRSILKIIGDKYLLSGFQRSVLLRGVVKRDTALLRRSKLILKEKDIKNEILLVDCYNVIITIMSYLNGNFVYIGNDGFLRDTAESHGKIRRSDELEKALSYLFKYLKPLGLKEVHFFLDSPISYSKVLARRLGELLTDHDIEGFAKAVRSPDHSLIHEDEGIRATSDSSIIDNCDGVFDLSFHALKHHFSPDFLCIDKFIE